MEMKVAFIWSGLYLQADVDFTPGTPDKLSPPDDAYEGDASECVILNLETTQGYDANFLLESTLVDDIAEAARGVCESSYEEEERMSPPAGADV